MGSSRTLVQCLFALLLVGAVPARAEFCEDLSVILDSGKEGFAAIRGELITRHEDPVSDMRMVWQCQKMLPGANTCEIDWFRQAYNYTAFWHRASLEAHAQAFAALDELLGGCGLTKKQTSKTGRSIWFKAEEAVDLDVVLAYNVNRVRLTFTASGFPNP